MHNNQNDSISRTGHFNFQKEIEIAFQNIENELYKLLKIQPKEGYLIEAASYEESIDPKEVHVHYPAFIAAYNAYKKMMFLKLNALLKLSANTDAYSSHRKAIQDEFEKIKQDVHSMLHGSQGRTGIIRRAVKELMNEPGELEEHAKSRLVTMTQQLKEATEANLFGELKADKKKIDSLKKLTDDLKGSMEQLVSSFSLKSMDEYENQRKEKEKAFISIFKNTLRQKHNYPQGKLINIIIKLDPDLGERLQKLNNFNGISMNKHNADWLIEAVLQEMFATPDIFSSTNIYTKLIEKEPSLSFGAVKTAIQELVPHFQEIVRNCKVNIKNKVEAKLKENDQRNGQFREEIKLSKSTKDYKKADLKQKVKNNFHGITPKETDNFILENLNIFFYHILQENENKPKVDSKLFDYFLKDEEGFSRFNNICEILNSEDETKLVQAIQEIKIGTDLENSDIYTKNKGIKDFLVGSYKDLKKLLLLTRASNLTKKISSNEKIAQLLGEVAEAHQKNNQAALVTPQEKLAQEEIMLCLPYYIISWMENEKDLNSNEDRLIIIFSSLFEQIENSGSSKVATSTDVKSTKAMKMLMLLDENKNAILENLHDFTFAKRSEPIHPIATLSSALSLSESNSNLVAHHTQNTRNPKKARLEALSKEVDNLKQENLGLTNELAAYNQTPLYQMDETKLKQINRRLEDASTLIAKLEAEIANLSGINEGLHRELSTEKDKNEKNTNDIKTSTQKVIDGGREIEALATTNKQLDLDLGKHTKLVETLTSTIDELREELKQVTLKLDTANNALGLRNQEIEKLTEEKSNLQEQLRVSQAKALEAADLATKPVARKAKIATVVMVGLGCVICCAAIATAVFCPPAAALAVTIAIMSLKVSTIVPLLVGSGGLLLMAGGLITGLYAYFKEKSHQKECTAFKDNFNASQEPAKSTTTTPIASGR